MKGWQQRRQRQRLGRAHDNASTPRARSLGQRRQCGLAPGRGSRPTQQPQRGLNHERQRGLNPERRRGLNPERQRGLNPERRRGVNHDRQRGITLTELLVVMTLAGIALSVGSLYLKPAEAPVQTAAVLLEGTLRQARMKAIANTSAFRVRPLSSVLMVTERAGNCSAATWTADPQLDLELPEDVDLSGTAWSVCFSSRGISNNNVVITLTHPDYNNVSVEVLLGGTTRIL